MSNIYSLVEVSSAYKLDEEETKKLIQILINQESTGYEGAILILLKEMNYNTPAIIRLLESDSIAKRSIFTFNFNHRFKLLIREAVLLTEVEQLLKHKDSVSATKLSRTPRYKALGLTRNEIHRVIRKYNIEYKKQNKQRSKPNG